MTLRPLESREVVGLDDEDHKTYKTGPTCSVPGCTRLSDHAHHLFSRGLMGGAFPWVKLPDGTETGNLVGLCFRHHEQVTDNVVAITWDEMSGMYLWDGSGQLSPQPPVRGHTHHVHDQEVDDIYTEDKSGRRMCPTCKRTIPRPKPEVDNGPEEKKIRKTWAVSVPYTAEENGADTLDALLEAAREDMDRHGLDWGQGHKVKFYVLSTALALFVQHSEKILSDQ